MSENDSHDYHPTIHDLPSSERPRERLLREGPTALSTASCWRLSFGWAR